ncbi:MAG: ABC transporter permease, partial [Phaeodactylibacter sp.]|nr:ABC transporter permease [Phaeodactylibacter sp.]
RDERSFDAFHARKGQLCRLNEIQSFPGTNTQHVALSMPGMGPNLQKDYPEVLNFTRFWGRGKRLFEKGDTRLIVEEVVGVDSTFLELFSFQLLEGDPTTALDEPYSIVLSRETAEKFFGGGRALGESLAMNGKPYKITGIAENVPENSHLQFDALLSISTVTRENPEFNNEFGSNYMVTYLLLDPAADAAALESKMPEFLSRHMPPESYNGQDVNDFYALYFQPLPDVHLASMNVEHDYQNYRKFNGV